MRNCCKYVPVPASGEMKPMRISQVLCAADSLFIYKTCWKSTFLWFFFFFNFKKLKWEPNYPTRGKRRMPAYEKCETEGFPLCSCRKILATVSHPPTEFGVKFNDTQYNHLHSDFDFDKSFVRHFSLIWCTNRWNPTKYTKANGGQL